MDKGINRRTFMQSTAAVGAGLFVGNSAIAQAAKKDPINVGLLGAGSQGQVLMASAMPLKGGLRFKAVCDIWPKNRDWMSKRLNAYSKPSRGGHAGTPYTDFEEMIDKEDLDAVIVATPDFWHSRHAVACLNKGLHVYCEKEMSNTLEGAKAMVEAAKTSGKLLQIGHQRRSNPRYQFCYDNIIKKANLLGNITTINGQWNRGRKSCADAECIATDNLPQEILDKYGFKNMHQFLNWRWFKGLGGGPFVDLGSHQIDIYSWFLDNAKPVSVMASGGIDYWKNHEWYDNVMAIYEFKKADGNTVRAFYQTLTTNSSGGYFEQFMGDDGALQISEADGRQSVFRETDVDEKTWDKWQAGETKYIKPVKAAEKPAASKAGIVEDIRVSPKPPEYKLLTELNEKPHTPHLRNFLNAVRDGEKLNCPAELGYETAVMVLKVNEAIEKGCKLEFKPEEFHV